MIRPKSMDSSFDSACQEDAAQWSSFVLKRPPKAQNNHPENKKLAGNELEVSDCRSLRQKPNSA
jgi:hypothetical protein